MAAVAMGMGIRRVDRSPVAKIYPGGRVFGFHREKILWGQPCSAAALKSLLKSIQGLLQQAPDEHFLVTRGQVLILVKTGIRR